MKKCGCRHLGHCPFQSDPLVMTDLKGNRLFRALTEKELLTSRMMVEGQTLHDPEPGDFCGTDQEGTASVLGKAIDPDVAVAYTKGKLGKRCKADGFMWRKRHPVPGEK